jgi:hypothetical protein
MFRLHHFFRFQYALAAASLLATCFFFFVYRPLGKNANRLDQSLNDTWKKLVDINLKNKTRLGMDLETVSQNLMVADKSINALKRACQTIRNQLEFDELTRERMRQPFQLLDYEQRRFQIIDSLTRLAVSNRVTLEPATVAGLPQYVSGLDHPGFLWAQLALASRILNLAITNHVSAVGSLQILPNRLHYAPDSDQVLFEEYPVHITLSGSMESALHLLLALSSRNPPLGGLGPPPSPTQALFLDRVLLTSAPGNPNQIALDAIICGFLNRSDLP